MALPFRAKTILGIALIELAVLSLLLWRLLGYMEASSETEYRQLIAATTRAYGVAARDAVVASDLGVLRSLTRQMLNYPGVTYARVRDAQGRTLGTAARRRCSAVNLNLSPGAATASRSGSRCASPNWRCKTGAARSASSTRSARR